MSVNLKHKVKPHKQPSKWQRLFSSIHTRILACYVLLMMTSALVTVLLIRQILLTRMQERIERSLIQEVLEFHHLVEGRDPATGEPFGDNIPAIFDVFLRRNIPEDHEVLLTIFNGELYLSRSKTESPVFAKNGEFVKSLAQLTQPQYRQVTAQTGETILYRAEPLILGKNRGVFVVARLISHDRQEVNEAIIIMIDVTIGVLIVASIVAWFVAKQITAPLRLLTQATGSINESGLTYRLQVQRFDEIGELTNRFNQMLDRLQSAFTSQKEFINDVGHELRTPITIIQGHLELMEIDSSEQRETLALVTDELDRMTRFVEDLLLLAKAEQPNFLHLDIVNVASFTEELFAKVKALAPRHWRLDMKGNGRIAADRQRLTQAITNLAQNATQHTKINDTIAIGSTLKNDTVYFWVYDTGEGITEADQQRIFKRFVRGANSNHRSEGSGLGLAIVQAIAQAHGGRIELVSRRGDGTKFSLILPIDPV